MYAWIWRRLPGGTRTKAVLAALLVLGVVALLMLVVFPEVESRLRFGDVTVG